MTRVAFMGDPGSYSHAAALAEGGPGAEPVSCPRFAEVFSAVAQGRADVGVVPVENSEAGPVGEVLDLLLGCALLVCAERVLPIRHALLAPAGRTLAGLRRVHSHPQALAQCRAFIQAHGLEEVPEADTATAARKMSEFRPHASAAIASPAAGVLYGLEVLALGLETNPENATRFLTLGTSARPWSGAAKTLIVFGLGEHPGDLVDALAPLIP